MYEIAASAVQSANALCFRLIQT